MIRNIFNYNEKSKKISETKKVCADKINSIRIHSDISDIKISACNTNQITATLNGKVITNREIDFYVIQIKDEIRICVNLDESEKSNNINISNCNAKIVINCNVIKTEGLTLDVKIPYKKFELLYIISKNGEVDVTSNVNVKKLDIYDKNGDTKVEAILKSLSIECKNGSIKVDTEAKDNVDLNICSKNGDVDVRISNIGKANVDIYTKNGTSKNKHKLDGSYTATGSISSKNGDVRFS